MRACADDQSRFLGFGVLGHRRQLVLGRLQLTERHSRGRGIGIIFQTRNLFFIHQSLHAIQVRLRVIRGGLRGFHIGARHCDVGR